MKQIIHQVHDELNMACEYIECASHMEGDDKDTYKSISRDELNHAEKLIILGDSHVASMPELEKDRVIWEYQRELFMQRWTKLKAEWSIL